MMIELQKTEPVYFYRVTEFVTTFEADKDKTEPLYYTKDFSGFDLIKCKREAEEYYTERLKGFESASFIYPFASPQDFQFEKNSAFSLTLSLVEHYNENDEDEYPLIGEDDETIQKSQELENHILKTKGYR